jgi:hypothetical protein
MSHPVVSVTPDIPIEACMALMTQRRFRHLPVVEEGRLIGIVSIGDIGKAIIADQRIAIHDLETYITGAPASGIGKLPYITIGSPFLWSRPLARADPSPSRGAGHAHHGGDAVLARDDGAVGHQPAHLGHQPSGDQEQRGPGRIGAGTHQDLPRRQGRPARVQDHADGAFGDTRRDGAANQDSLARPLRRGHSLVERLAVAEHQARICRRRISRRNAPAVSR